jgi:5S rRNA maturation endonuclease (ribonuclease M5)
MIPKKHYIEAGKALAVGEQTSINHTHCSAGEDTRSRLFVKNTGTAIIAYCHNCADKGFSLVRDKVEQRRVASESSIYCRNKSLVTDCSSDALRKRGLRRYEDLTDDQKELFKLAIDWLPETMQKEATINIETGRLCLPMNNTEGKVCGWQERRVLASDPDKAKYRTYKTEEALGWSERRKKADDLGCLVITEDIASAIHIQKSALVSTIALMSTSASQELILHIAQNYKKVVIWLDPDGAGQDGAWKLKDRLKLFMPVFSLRTVIEAKHLTTHDINELLNPNGGEVWKKLEEQQKDSQT